MVVEFKISFLAFVNGDKSGLQAVNSDDTIKEKEPSEAFQQIQKACEADKVEHRPVQKLSQPLSSDEIIERLAGGDMTIHWKQERT